MPLPCTILTKNSMKVASYSGPIEDYGLLGLGHGCLNGKKHRNEKPFRRWIYKNTKSIIYFTGSFAAFSQQQKLDEEIKKMDENHKVLQEPRGDLGMLSR